MAKKVVAKRKYLSKRIRFEVFKRDSFRCQYCGGTAPEVLLEVDHIKPVADGGDNDISNLITSCKDCNRGKGAVTLDDNTVIKKQRKQLEELNKRRQQLEMMLEWREGLRSLDDAIVTRVEDYYTKETGYCLTHAGQVSVRKWIKKYSVEAILRAIDVAVEQYAKYDFVDKVTKESVEVLFDMIPKICHCENAFKEKPYLKELFYIRGILRNRLTHITDWQALQYLEQAHLKGMSLAALTDLAKYVRNWTSFCETMEDYLQQESW